VRPEAAFGADLIAGFPTETEAMFQNTLALVADAGLSYLHVFPFSPRKGTPAARMPQLPRAVVRERAARLRAAGEATLASRLQSLAGTEQHILIEKPGEGRTPCFALSRLDVAAVPGDIVRARISSSDGRTLGAQLLRNAA
jgi:threonylcarbamoyladenosine tRNA methylthiotransferase MtaB